MRTTHKLHFTKARAVALTGALLLLAGLGFAFAPMRPVAAARQSLAARVNASTAVGKVLALAPAPIRRAIKKQLAQTEANKAGGVSLANAAMFAPVTITKDAVPPTGSAVGQGQVIVYNIQATNGSSSDTTVGAGGFIRIIDSAPAGTLFTNVTVQQQPQFGSAWSCTILGGGTSIQCSAGDDAGAGVDTFTTQEFVKIRAEATVGAATAIGTTLTNTATYSFSQAGGAPTTVTSNATVHTVRPTADLSLSKFSNAGGGGGNNVTAGGTSAAFTAPGVVAPGPGTGNIDYQLLIGNGGPGNGSSVIIQDAFPSNTVLVSAPALDPATVTINGVAQPTFAITCNVFGGNFIECRPGDNTVINPAYVADVLPAGFSARLNYRVRVPANVAQGTIVQNQARISSVATNPGPGTLSVDPNPANNAATPVNTNVNAFTDLGITKVTSNPTPVAGGAAFSYTLTVSNNGPSDANNIVVNDPLPPGVIFQNVAVVNNPSVAGYGLTCTGPANATNGTVTCTGNLSGAPGASTSTITIVAQIAANNASGVRTNTATVSSSTTEATPNTFPNTASVQQNIVVDAPLSITKTGPATACAGDTITYNVTVANNGSSTALVVSVADTLPAGVTALTATATNAFAGACSINQAGTVVTCSAAAVPTGTSVITITARIAPGTAPGPATNSALLTTGTGTITGTNPATFATTVSRCTDLGIDKTAPSSAFAGGIIDYNIKVTNNGPSTVTGAGTVTITDVLPTGVTPVANPFVVGANLIVTPVGSFTCTYTAGTNTVTCTNTATPTGDLAVGGMATITFKVMVASNFPQNTNLNNCASVAVAGTGVVDTNAGNNSDCASTVITGSADLAVSKTSTPVVDPDGAGPLAPVALPAGGGNVPPGGVSAGGYIRYDVPFGNNGPSDAINVLLSNTVPGNTAFVGALATGGVFVPATQPPAVPFTFTIAATKAASPTLSVTCTVTGAPGTQQLYCRPQGNTAVAAPGPYADGTLPAGYTATLSYFVKVNESVTGGTIVSDPAVITSGLCPPFPPTACASTPDPNTSNNTSQTTQNVVVAASQLSISKIVQSAVTTASNPNQTGPIGPASPPNGVGTTSFASIIGLGAANTLVRVSPSAPATVIGAPLPITGLVVGDTIVGIDTRPATGGLYGLGVNGAVAHLYLINTMTGVAAQVGGNIALPQSAGAAAGTDYGFDFNPTVDRIRVVANGRDNFRLNPDTGAVAGVDTALTAGSNIVGAAYDRNFASATQTTLYAIDATTDQLVTIGGINSTPSPNGGAVTVIGALGVNTTNAVGFDIANDGAGTAYASLTVAGTPNLYTINLTTGAATLVGTLPAGVTDITTAAAPAVAATGVVPGTTLTYRVTITNNGPSDVANVRFTDTLPAGLETATGRVLGVRYVSVSQVPGIGGATFTCAPPTGIPPASNPQSNGGQVVCTAPILAANTPNNVAAFDVTVFIDPATKLPLTNTSRVDATINNFNTPVSATTVLTTPVAPTSDLALTKTHTNAAGVVGGPVTAGEVFTYTITVNNNGPSAAQMFTLVDTLPIFQQVRSISVAQSPDGNGAPAVTCTATPAIGAPTGTGANTTSVTCTAAELPPNRNPNGTVNPAGTFVVTLTVRQDQGTTQPLPVVYQNCVTANSMSFDPNTTNNIMVCDTIPVIFLANPVGTKTATPNPVIAGNLLTYTITATNPGPSAALNFRITDPLPTGTVFISAVASPGATLTTPAVGANGVVTAVYDAAGGTPGGLTLPGVTRTLTIVVRVCPDFQQILGFTDAQMCVPNLTDTATISSDTPGTSSTASFTSTVQAQSDLSLTKTAPAQAPFSTTPGPSNVTYTLTFANAGPSNANGVQIVDVLPKGFTVASVANPLTSTVPGTTFTTATVNGITTVTANLGVLGAANQCLLTRPISGTVTIIATVPIKNPVQTVTNTATISTTNCLADPNLANNTASASTFIFDPGAIGSSFPAASEVSDQKAGSILFYPIYTSDLASVQSNNTRISMTNISSTERVAVHLFAVDGASCAVLDAYICLTPNQTISFLASDVDPGNTGYIMAVAVDLNTGLPRSFNCLIGDEFVKFGTGFRANLGAEAISAVMNFPAGLNASATSTVLRFDGMFYNRLPRVLALDNIGSIADGNSTMLILDRVGGDFLNASASIGNLNGLLFNDQEVGFSFTARADVCQLRTLISTTFPRTFPPITTSIPAGRSGWLKLWTVEDRALFGASIVANLGVNSSPNAYAQGHNLHKLTLTDAAAITVPLFPPSCSN